MTKPISFTQASLARAIRAVELAGRFVIAVKPDGTLIVGDKPIQTADFVPAAVQDAPAANVVRLFGENLHGGKRAA